MTGNDGHKELMDWLLKDAARGGDVAYTTRLVNAIGMFFLHQANPEVYEALESTMTNTREVEEQRNSPKQIGQLVAKQDNNYLMGEMLGAQMLQILQTKNKQNGNDGRREEDAF
jgi:hypothetical protein